jgi:capsule polysaccharide export protein KpsE/RkpR
VEEQAKAVIEGIANLRAQIAAKEVEIKVMRTYSTHSNPDLQQAEEVLKGLKGELSKLEAKSGGGHDPLMPTGRMPAVGMEYIRKMRDVKFNEALLELLSKQYELARLDEAKDAAVIQIIDRAIPLDKKNKPKRALMVIMGTFVGFFFAIFAVFIKELQEKTLANGENRERYESLKKYISFRRKR